MQIVPRQYPLPKPIPLPHLALQTTHIPSDPLLSHLPLPRGQEPSRLRLLRTDPEKHTPDDDRQRSVDDEDPDPVGNVRSGVNVTGAVRDETADEGSQALRWTKITSTGQEDQSTADPALLLVRNLHYSSTKSRPSTVVPLVYRTD